MEKPKVIYNVSHTQLSIARHYGGINYNGSHYIYNAADDTLTLQEPKTRKKREVKK